MGGGWVDRTTFSGALMRECCTADVWRDERVGL